ncbi:MAG: complex I NDUFA9 subunit family protein [Alphaproteobacteria bacterium]|nr:complex I NDUFA9 subunit family protein [Alphaproteobacteria bacterium]MDA7982686.1 complex I NDUFA9 subunit family protein [Alphaproteobacteria bacterium]MDA7988288.1 complex I NDUFA9 subunit family protein [Alphaproteobacteria bacterium]MDA8008695.1 complex I NDUFA9 subunit family protein [Alphaproteobacteria bacterium]
MSRKTHQRPRTAVVFGGCGFVGRYVTAGLLRRGWRVVAVSRRPRRDLLPLGNPGQITLARLDFRTLARDNPDNSAALTSLLRDCDAAVNLVGILHTRRPGGFRAVHAAAAGAIATAAREAGAKRLVHVSALGAAAESASRYGRSKGMGEKLVLENYPRAAVLRPSVIFGKEDDFLNRFAALLRGLPAFPLFGGGETKFQPVYVGDVARAIVRLAADSDDSFTPPPWGKTFDLGGPEVMTLRHLLERVAYETGWRRKFVNVPFGAAAAMSAPFVILPRPPLTPDQVLLLREDNIAASDGFAALGMESEPLGFRLGEIVGRYGRAYRMRSGEAPDSS